MAGRLGGDEIGIDLEVRVLVGIDAAVIELNVEDFVGPADAGDVA